MAVPTIFNKLIQYYEAEGMSEKADKIKKQIKHYRLMVSGSSALPEKSMEKWKDITGF